MALCTQTETAITKDTPMPYARHHPHLTPDQEVALVGCSTDGYYADMRRHFEAGSCPFCAIDHAKNTVIEVTEPWSNRWRCWKVGGDYTTRAKTATQILFFPKDHIGIEELTREHWADRHDIHKWVKKNYTPRGGGTADRWGETEYNVGTVPYHYHLTYYLPTLAGGVIVPFAKDADRIESDTQKMLKRKKLFEDGEI